MPEPKTYTEQATISEILTYISESINYLVACCDASASRQGEAIAELYNLVSSSSSKAKYIGDELFEIEYPE